MYLWAKCFWTVLELSLILPYLLPTSSHWVLFPDPFSNLIFYPSLPPGVRLLASFLPSFRSKSTKRLNKTHKQFAPNTAIYHASPVIYSRASFTNLCSDIGQKLCSIGQYHWLIFVRNKTLGLFIYHHLVQNWRWENDWKNILDFCRSFSEVLEACEN